MRQQRCKFVEETRKIIHHFLGLFEPAHRQIYAATAEAHVIAHHPRAAEIFKQVENRFALAKGVHHPLAGTVFVALRARPDRQQHLAVRARDALARVGLGHIAGRPLAQTSYGERRRVEIAMALAQNPKLLLLDEPFAGLSIDERQDVRKLLLAIPRDVTIVMIEHDMDTALELADRITLLHFGEVIVEGSRAEVVADRRTREVYLGE